jgi:hypothetical protein
MFSRLRFHDLIHSHNRLAAQALFGYGQDPATLGGTFFAADLKPALALAGVLLARAFFAFAQKLCPPQLLMPEHRT